MITRVLPTGALALLVALVALPAAAQRPPAPPPPDGGATPRGKAGGPGPGNPARAGAAGPA